MAAYYNPQDPRNFLSEEDVGRMNRGEGSGRTLWGDIGGAIGEGWDWLNESPADQWANIDRSNYDLPGYDRMNAQYAGLIGQGARHAPNIAGSDFRGRQVGLADALQAQAMGQGPGQEIARRQAMQAVDRGMAQQMSGARSAMPGQSAMAARNAAMASGNLQAQGAQAASMGGLQAQQGAIGALGGLLGQARGQDLSRATSQAGMQLQQRGMDDQRQLELLRQRLQMSGMQQQGGMGFEQNRMNRYMAAGQQPSRLERGLGMAAGLGMAYMGMPSGAGSAARSPWAPVQGGQAPGGYVQDPSGQWRRA